MVEVKKKKLPRIFICIDRGMIWENAGDIEAMLIIKNIDKQWIRYLPVRENKEAVDEEEELLHQMMELDFKPHGLEKEELYQLRKKRKNKKT